MNQKGFGSRMLSFGAGAVVGQSRAESKNCDMIDRSIHSRQCYVHRLGRAGPGRASDSRYEGIPPVTPRRP